jgi:hypothetical protein
MAEGDDVASLLAASNEEMQYKGHIEGFAAYAPQKDWEEYSATSRIINDYIDLANEEMERRVTTASGNVETTAQALHTEAYARDEARTYHAKPVHH